MREKLNKQDNLPTGNEIHDLSASLGKVRVELDACQAGSGDALPSFPICPEKSSRNSVSSQSEKKTTNQTTWKLPTVSNFPNKVEVRPHTQPEVKKFPSVLQRHKTTHDVKVSCSNAWKQPSHKNTETATEIPEIKKTGNNVTKDLEKTADDMRVAELHYLIDCILKNALFPDIYHTVKRRLINLPTAEQEMIIKFFKEKAEAITEVRRPQKLNQLLNFLMRGKQFGMENGPMKTKENPLKNLLSRRILMSPPRRREKRFELTTWHHRPVHKPTDKCIQNRSSFFVNACHMAPVQTHL